MIIKNLVNMNIIALIFAFFASMSSIAGDLETYEICAAVSALNSMKYDPGELKIVAQKNSYSRRVPFNNTVLSGKVGFLFNNDEILKKYQADQGPAISTAQYAKKIANGRHLIGQNALANSGAAVVNMILLDHGIQTDNALLVTKSALSGHELANILAKNGLTIHEPGLFTNLYKSCDIWLQTYTAMIRLENSEIGDHWVILDRADELGNVVLRDPFHEWCVKISLDSLMKRNPTKVIIIKN